MKLVGKTLAVAAMLLTGACDVTVNNKSVDDTVEAAARDAENLAGGAEAALERAGGAVENHAEALGDRVDALGESIDNRVDINVDLDGKDAPAESNKS